MKNKVFFLFFFTINFYYSFSQNLEVNSVNHEYSQSVTADSTGTLRFLTISMNINDIELVGQVSIDLIESSFDVPMIRIKKSREQLISDGQVNNNIILIPIGDFDSSLSYTLKILFKNFNMLDLPQSIKVINPEN